MVVGKTKALVFLEGQHTGLCMLDRIKDSVDSCLDTGFYKATCCFGDRLESFRNSFGIQTQMRDQGLATRQVLCLRQRAEDSLEQGRVRVKFSAEETETVQLCREMRSCRLQRRQRFPIARVMDDVLCILACSFGVPPPLIFHSPILCTE